MLNEQERRLNDAMQNLAESLDIPPNKYKEAVERYGAVGKWLEEGEYDGCTDTPTVGPQGSFRLGTVVRPLRDGKEADYDIDLVCQLPQDKATTDPGNLKMAVGDRLKENADYAEMLDEEGRRCWTLQYAEKDGVGFHVDILPSVPDHDLGRQSLTVHGVDWQYAQHAIATTEKDKAAGTHSWKDGGSNPEGFAKWFDGINKPTFARIVAAKKRLLYERSRAVYCSVAEVPDALVRTPLQQAIQILKRHRDRRFLRHKWGEDKPKSMIITTLAARAYQGDPDVYTALLGIVDRLELYALLLKPGAFLTKDMAAHLIERQEDRWRIPNPVNPGENFADRWNDPGSHGAEAFFQWVSWVKQDIESALKARDAGEAKALLVSIFGAGVSNAAAATGPAGAKTPGDYPTVHLSNPSKPWSPGRV